MDAQESWWFAATEGLNGPHTQGEIFEAVRMGRVRSQTLLRLGEQGEWVPAAQAFPAAFPSQDSTMGAISPQLPENRSAATQPNASSATRNLNSPVDVGVSVLLTLITLGIWFFFWLYPRLTWYAQESGRSLGNRVAYFWLLVGLSIGSVVFGLVTFVFAFLLIIAALVFGALLTHLLVVDQVTIVESSPSEPAKIVSPSTMVVLYVVAGVLSLTVVLIPIGIVVYVFFYMYLFRNHNAVIESLRR